MTMLLTMGALLLKASAVMAAGFVVALTCRRAAAATRHLVWTFVVAALLVLPALTFLMPDRLMIRVTPRTTAAFSRAALPWTLESHERASVPLGASTLPSTDTVTRSTLSIGLIAAAIYAAGVLLLLLRLGITYVVAWRAVQRAVPVHDLDWIRELRAAEAAVGLRRPVALRRTRDHVMPFVVGTRRPTVMLPATADLWPDDRRRAVLLHELAHVSRLDCAVQILAAIACAFYWAHPGVWWIARRLRIEQELACDDRVLATGEEPASYAGHLLELAHAMPATSPRLAAAMAGAGPVERRIRALLDDGRRRRGLSRRTRTLAGVVTTAVVLPLAALGAAPLMPLLPIQEGTAARFDVVSVKPNNSVGQGGQISRRDGKGGLSIVNQTLRALIQFAYQLQPSQLADAPDWINRERFDIEGRTSLKLPVLRLSETSQEALMLRAVLAERFNLRVRREPRPLQVFALAVTRADRRLGPNLRRPTNDFCERRFEAYKSGATLPNPDGQVCGISGSNDQLTAGSFALSSFANFLSGRVRRIVIDRTNLDGVWDFTLKWTPNEAQQTDPDRPSIFTALEEQLGLKLESTTAPIDVLVVERVERPTPD